MSDVLTPSSLSNKAIADYASVVGNHYNIYEQDGRADVERFLKTLGGRKRQSQDFFAPEALTVHGPGNFEIHLPPLTSDRRDRFTIAHELGHYFLHYVHPGYEGTRHFGRGQRNRAETQANVFAASLLMPQEQFTKAFRRYGDDWWSVADVFGVSPSAASVRAQVLGLT